MQRLQLPIDQIVVTDRMRLDLGDIEDLARSIERYGLIQPVIINQHNVLIAGGRRLRACQVLKRTHVDVVYRETLGEDELRELELEENLRRKDMDWRERVRAIRTIHLLKRRNASLDSRSWGYRETGELLGVAHSQIAYALDAAELLDRGDKDVAACQSLSDFLRLMLRRREDEAHKELARRGLSVGGTSIVAQPQLVTDLLMPAATPLSSLAPATTGESFRANLSRWLYHGDVRAFFRDENRSDPAGDSISYIITDPPYAIDMKNMSQAVGGMLDIDLVEEEHRVEENVELLKEFIPLAYHHMRNAGSWLVMWCDCYNWMWLCGLCEQAGFRVQRWPLVWVKTHPCTNTNAMKNWTKNVEFALVASKGNATLVSPQAVCQYACSNDEVKRLLGHPFAKPLDLWKWVYRAVVPTGTGLAVFDPFAGRGSSVLAAIDLGLVPVACEKNDVHYTHLYNHTRSRYEQVLGKDRVTFT